MARLSVLAITAVAVIAIPEAQAVDTSSNAAETEGVTVTGEAMGSLTSELPENEGLVQLGLVWSPNDKQLLVYTEQRAWVVSFN